MNIGMRGFAAGAIALTDRVLGAAHAQLLYSLAAPTGGVEPGATIEVHLAVLNRSATDAMIARDASSGLALLEHQLAGPGPTRTALEITPAPKPNARLFAAAVKRPTTNLARAEPAPGHCARYLPTDLACMSLYTSFTGPMSPRPNSNSALTTSCSIFPTSRRSE